MSKNDVIEMEGKIVEALPTIFCNSAAYELCIAVNCGKGRL